MAHYFISGVWKNNNVITHVFAHSYNAANNTFESGSKVSEDNVIRNIRLGHTYQTINWSYSSVTWRKGANVLIVKEGNREFLRTAKDASVEDNLDNLINLAGFF